MTLFTVFHMCSYDFCIVNSERWCLTCWLRLLFSTCIFALCILKFWVLTIFLKKPPNSCIPPPCLLFVLLFPRWKPNSAALLRRSFTAVRKCFLFSLWSLLPPFWLSESSFALYSYSFSDKFSLQGRQKWVWFIIDGLTVY